MLTVMADDPTSATRRALAAIRRNYDQAASKIETSRNPERAFAAADELARGIRELYDTKATRLVSRMAMRLREARRYSLVELARAVNVSKQRASQWASRERVE